MCRHGKIKNFQAHRVSYFLRFGAFDESLFVCHKCDNPKCVNPDHFFLGTNLENVRDMMNKGRYVGTKGHKWDDAYKRKMSLAVRGEKNGHYGKHHSPEVRERLRDANLGKVMSEETRDKIRKANTGKKRSPETCRRISEAKKAFHASKHKAPHDS